VIESKPFYWVVCDEQGCEARCPDEDDESIAWAEADQAVAVAQDSEWLVVGSKHYCWEHREAHEKDRPIEGQEPLL
jgi:hypothetical protein